MTGVYTKLVQKRVEQSKEADGVVSVSPTDQHLSQEMPRLPHTRRDADTIDTPAERKKSESQKVNNTHGDAGVRKSESQQNDLSENQQSAKVTLSTKTAKRFTTYLTKASLRAIRIIADDEERHDYEVFQEAIDFYLTHRKQ
jgi:hypothetical protein